MINYIDLCSGIGGFHQAVDRVCERRNIKSCCLFAADNDISAAKIYEKNYGINSYYDLKDETTHDLINKSIQNKEVTFLFAGFPCQPFSKAGNQEGFKNETKGTIFFEIEKIIRKHKPKFVLLENVRNLEKHDKGNTWGTIKDSLIRLGYIVDHVILSPNEIETACIPALRDRIFIICYRQDLDIVDPNYIFGGKKFKKKETSIYLDNDIERGLNPEYFNINSESDLDSEKIETIEMWNDLYHMLKDNNRKIISPLWPSYFNCDVESLDEEEWKKKLIKKNVDFYRANKDIYDLWYSKHKSHFDTLSKSDRKFEWNAGDSIDDIWQGIIQFRPSGVRVKKPDFIPTLVAIKQTPILGIERRYMQPDEMARIYGFKSLNFDDQILSETYKQLGNTVSVDVVEYLINHMLEAVEG